MPTSPARSRRQAASRSRGGSALCSTATSSPKRARKRAASCGVSAISGHQHQRAPPGRARRRDDAQVDLGLARAGDPCSRKRREARPPARRSASSTACTCAGVERDPPPARGPRAPRRARATARCSTRARPGRDQRAQRASARAADSDDTSRPSPAAASLPASARLRAGALRQRVRGRPRRARVRDRRRAAAGSAPRRPPRPAPPSTSRGSCARRARHGALEAPQPQLAAGRRERGQHRVDARRVRRSARAAAPAPARPAAVRRTARVALGLLALGQRRAQHLAERRLVVVGHPAAEPDHRLVERRLARDDLLDVARRRRARRAPLRRARRRSPSRCASRTGPPPARRSARTAPGAGRGR